MALSTRCHEGDTCTCTNLAISFKCPSVERVESFMQNKKNRREKFIHEHDEDDGGDSSGRRWVDKIATLTCETLHFKNTHCIHLC